MGSVEDADRQLRLKLVDVHLAQLATLGSAKMQILIQLSETGEISVFGNVLAKNPTLALLDQAREKLAQNHTQLEKGKHLIIKEQDTSIPKARHYTLECDTARLGAHISQIKGA